MLVTKKDTDRLNSFYVDIFTFDCFNAHFHNESLYNKIVDFIESKSFKNMNVMTFADLHAGRESQCMNKKKVIKMLKEKELYFISVDEHFKYTQDFFSTFLGQDIKALEPIFTNYRIHKDTAYFTKKGLFAPNSIIHEFIIKVCDLQESNESFFANYSECLEHADINYIYNNHNLLFSNFDTSVLFKKTNKDLLKDSEKILKNISKNPRGDEAKINLFINQLKNIIVFKRPIAELDALLSTQPTFLRNVNFHKFVKTLNYSIMPEIIDKINFYINNSKTLITNNILVEPEKEDYQIVNISVLDIDIKYIAGLNICRDAVRKKMTLICETLNIQQQLLDSFNKDGKMVSYALKGSQKSINMASSILHKTINDSSMLFEKNDFNFQQFCNICIEKSEIDRIVLNQEQVSPKRNTHKL